MLLGLALRTVGCTPYYTICCRAELRQVFIAVDHEARAIFYQVVIGTLPAGYPVLIFTPYAARNDHLPDQTREKLAFGGFSGKKTPVQNEYTRAGGALEPFRNRERHHDQDPHEDPHVRT